MTSTKYRILILNKITPAGLDQLPRDTYEFGPDVSDPHALLVRSQDVHSLSLPDSLLCVGRAGIGVNNIPVGECTRRGIVVFNTPGGNANSVKELVILGLLISARRVVEAVSWCRSLAGNGSEVAERVEEGKSQFSGPEIRGRRLGVIGLGNVGSLVANDAIALGMNVSGFDPFISVESAWGLSRDVKRVIAIEELLAESDYITIHLPLTEKTRGMMNAGKFAKMKKGSRLLNFARGELVETSDLKRALADGTVAIYVTDFPDAELLDVDQVIPIPHLGASTPEAEENCAVMAAGQVRSFLEGGSIRNSVNFPDCSMPATIRKRILVANDNIPRMVSQITALLAEAGVNIADMINKHKDDVAYNIIDIDGDVDPATVDRIRKIDGVTMVRVIT